MTQFLFAAGENIRVPVGYSAIPASDDHDIEVAAIFGGDITVTRLAPVGSEMDTLVDRARDRVLHGEPVSNTELGVLLSALAQHATFALFWGNDFQNLPRASNLDELWQIIEPQLSEPVGNWELYVFFESAPEVV